MLLSCTQRVSIFFVVMAFDTRLVHMTVHLRSICTQLIFVLKALLTSYARHSLWVTIMLPFYYQDTCIITTCWIMLAPHLRLNDKCVNKFICHLTTLYAVLYQFNECLAFWYLNFLSKNKMLKWLNAALYAPAKRTIWWLYALIFKFSLVYLARKKKSPWEYHHDIDYKWLIIYLCSLYIVRSSD